MDSLLHWLQFGALGSKKNTSKTSALTVTLTVCNEFPSKTAMETVYSGMVEALEQEMELSDLFDKVFTLTQPKVTTQTTSTSTTVVNINNLNLQQELLQQQTQIPTTHPISIPVAQQVPQLTQVTTGVHTQTLHPTAQLQPQQPTAHTPSPVFVPPFQPQTPVPLIFT